MMCRQCPGYRKELSSALWICEPAQSEGPAKVPGDGPSTSSGTSTGHSRSHLSLNHALTHTHQQRNPCPSTCWNPLFSPCSSSGVQVCSSGQSPHLHLLPAAHAWPTLRVPSPSDVPTALWVALTPVHQCSQATAVTWWFVVRSFEQVWCARNLSVMCTGAASGSVVTAALRISAVGFCLVKISVWYFSACVIL